MVIGISSNANSESIKETEYLDHDLMEKASNLAELECESYNDCGPLDALQIYEKMLMINSDNEELLLQRNLMLMEVGNFDVRETNGDYIVNVQQIVRDRNGSLVSVIENAGADISPSLFMEKHLDEKEENAEYYKKEIVKIGDDEYVKWRYEIQMSSSEEYRKFNGKTISWQIIPNAIMKTTPGHAAELVDLRINLITALFPAINVDIGDSTWKITEVFKKI